MFKSLRSRLFASYLLLSLALMVLLVGALAATTAFSRARSFQTAIELNAVAQPVIRDFTDAIRDARQDGDTTFANADNLENKLDDIADRFDVRILWVNQQRRIRYDSGGNWNGITAPDDVVPRTSAKVLDAVNFYRDDDTGTDWVFYTPPTAQFGQTFLVFARPEPAQMAFFNNALTTPVRRSMIIALLLSGVLAFAIARSVARPLQRVASASEAVAHGDYDQQVPIAGPTEVRELATTFNAMTQRVKASQQSQRDFVANVSHDLKTPITSIQGWSQALLDGTADGEMLAKSAEIIHGEANRMSRMVQELLDLARIESGNFTLRKSEFLLNDLLQSLRDMFLPQAEAQGVALTVSAPSDLVISADVDRLTQVLTNIVDNALTHTQRNGVVRVEAGVRANEVSLRVVDTGKGIAADELARVFERFYQTDKARSHGRKGTGLGLAIAKEIVEAHGGRISAESQLGQGTTLHITLPTV